MWLTELNRSSLETVGGSMHVYLNEYLTELDISNLTSVGEDLDLWFNDLLTCDFTTWESQISVGGIIDVCGNALVNGCGPDDCP